MQGDHSRSAVCCRAPWRHGPLVGTTLGDELQARLGATIRGVGQRDLRPSRRLQLGSLLLATCRDGAGAGSMRRWLHVCLYLGLLRAWVHCVAAFLSFGQCGEVGVSWRRLAPLLEQQLYFLDLYVGVVVFHVELQENK